MLGKVAAPSNGETGGGDAALNEYVTLNMSRMGEDGWTLVDWSLDAQIAVNGNTPVALTDENNAAGRVNGVWYAMSSNGQIYFAPTINDTRLDVTLLLTDDQFLYTNRFIDGVGTIDSINKTIKFSLFKATPLNEYVTLLTNIDGTDTPFQMQITVNGSTPITINDFETGGELHGLRYSTDDLNILGFYPTINDTRLDVTLLLADEHFLNYSGFNDGVGTYDYDAKTIKFSLFKATEA